MPINCGPPPEERPPKPPRPKGRWMQEGILGLCACASDEDVFLPRKKHDELAKLIAEMTVTIEQQGTRITELEAENLVLKDMLLQAEFGEEEPKELPPLPELPPGPEPEFIRE